MLLLLLLQYLQIENASRGSSAQALCNLASKPYHYGSHYSNSGIVLHFLVRIPPFTGMFLDFQGEQEGCVTSLRVVPFESKIQVILERMCFNFLMCFAHLFAPREEL